MHTHKHTHRNTQTQILLVCISQYPRVRNNIAWQRKKQPNLIMYNAYEGAVPQVSDIGLKSVNKMS